MKLIRRGPPRQRLACLPAFIGVHRRSSAAKYIASLPAQGEKSKLILAADERR